MARISDRDAYDLVTSRFPWGEPNSERVALERVWIDSFAFYQGLHWFVRDRVYGIRAPRHVPDSRVFHTCNLILVNSMRNLARMTQVDGQYQVIPNSDDLEDLLSSQVAEKVFEARRKESRFKRQLQAVMNWALITGLGFHKVCWDPKAGPATRVYLNKKFELLKGGFTRTAQVDLSEEERRAKEESGDYEDVRTGDVKLHTLSPFAVDWDWRARELGIDECEFVRQKHLITREEAIKRYPDKEAQLRKVPAVEPTHGGLFYQELIATMAGGREGIRTAYDRPRYEHGNLIEISEYWERSCDDAPRGRLIALTHDLVLRNEDNPYHEAGIELPFVDYRWFPVPGQFAGKGLVTEMIGPQKAYNEVVSRVIEAIRMHGNPRVFAPRNSGVKETDLTTAPNNLVYYNHNTGVPTTVPPPAMPPHIMAQAAVHQSELELMAAQSDVTQGGAPGQLRGTGGVQLLLERNDLILSPISQNMLESVARVGRMELQLLGRHLKEDRLVKMVGRSMEAEVFYFRGSDLRSNYDLIVTGDPGNNTSSSSRMAIVEQAVSLGILNPLVPEDRESLLLALKLKHPDTALEDKWQEIRNERVVLDQMVRNPGVAVMPNPWDVAEIRLREINRFRRRPQWLKLPEQVQNLITARAQIYEQRVMMNLQAAQQMGAAEDDDEEPKGKPSQPKRPAQQAG